MRSSNLLRVLGVRTAKTTYPTGNPNFAVKQAFPAGFDEEESDPFLMCDYFGPAISKGKITDPDKFDVPWHPHRGMDIATYLKEGVGRHADSLGNRGEYATPGMQWISVGSGIEHAEGGGTPAGQPTTGFQIWINVPAAHKMDDPKYGTVEPKEFPMLSYEGGEARLLAGTVGEHTGPFQTKQQLQMIDFVFQSNAVHTHSVPLALDNCLLYVYSGSGQINNQAVTQHNVVRLDAANRDPEARGVTFTAGAIGFSVLLFAGKRLNEPIAWHGPFVMNTQEEIQNTILELRQGRFPPKRTAWDYKQWSTFPKEIRDQVPSDISQCL